MTPSAPLGTDAAEDRFGLRAAAGLRPGTAAERRFRFELAAHPGSVGQARHLTRARLSGWALCEDTCDTAAVVVSELVTNAILHSDSRRIVCELHDGDELVRIAVRDEGCAPDEPRPSPQRPEGEHGRGLLLVAALCRSWGAQDTGPGLVVWADLPRSAETGTEPRSDLGWGAKKPATERGGRSPEDGGTSAKGGGSGAGTSRGTASTDNRDTPRSAGNAGAHTPRSAGNAGTDTPRSAGNAGTHTPRSAGNAGTRASHDAGDAQMSRDTGGTHASNGTGATWV